MATRIAYTPTVIVINIADLVIDGTILKRRARLFNMNYRQEMEALVLTWIVEFFSNLDGEYGESLKETIPCYSTEIIANNDEAVNPATGEVLLPNSEGEYEMDYFGQYDFFSMVADNQPVLVNPMIRQYGEMVPVERWLKK